jgi:hypothetical protein
MMASRRSCLLAASPQVGQPGPIHPSIHLPTTQSRGRGGFCLAHDISTEAHTPPPNHHLLPLRGPHAPPRWREAAHTVHREPGPRRRRSIASSSSSPLLSSPLVVAASLLPPLPRRLPIPSPSPPPPPEPAAADTSRTPCICGWPPLREPRVAAGRGGSVPAVTDCGFCPCPLRRAAPRGRRARDWWEKFFFFFKKKLEIKWEEWYPAAFDASRLHSIHVSYDGSLAIVNLSIC